MATDTDIEVVEPRDNAADLTSGLVLTTTVLLLLSIWVVFVALDKFYARGPLAG
jgi:hypothetical protein